MGRDSAGGLRGDAARGEWQKQGDANNKCFSTPHNSCIQGRAMSPSLFIFPTLGMTPRHSCINLGVKLDFSFPVSISLTLQHLVIFRPQPHYFSPVPPRTKVYHFHSSVYLKALNGL